MVTCCLAARTVRRRVVGFGTPRATENGLTKGVITCAAAVSDTFTLSPGHGFERSVEQSRLLRGEDAGMPCPPTGVAVPLYGRCPVTISRVTDR